MLVYSEDRLCEVLLHNGSGVFDLLTGTSDDGTKKLRWRLESWNSHHGGSVYGAGEWWIKQARGAPLAPRVIFFHLSAG